MKITQLELFKVVPRWLFLKVSTDAGVAGWGEPIVKGRADTVAAAVVELSSYLIGRDPARIEDIWQTLYRGGFYRGGPILMSAIAGVDQAHHKDERVLGASLRRYTTQSRRGGGPRRRGS